MDQVAEQPKLVKIEPPGAEEAWRMVAGQLQLEMQPFRFNSWVRPLEVVSYSDGVFHLTAMNAYGEKWVNDRLGQTITRLLEGIYNQPVSLKISVAEHAAGEPGHERKRAASVAEQAPVVPGPETEDKAEGGKKTRLSREVSAEGSERKIMLRRYYGDERARVVQPDRYLPVTRYFFTSWLPILGHSAATTIIAARSLCYWNVATGDLRNVIETDMSTLAKLASVSLRTVKEVLRNELVKRYFLRYKVRRIVTQYGVRTAGIILQVRMDDPLTPEDQERHSLIEAERWYSADFDDETDD